MDLGGAGVLDVATATKLGDFFQYAIDKPVALPRQKSAMLPIVNKDMEGTRVQHLQRKTQAKFPLLGLKFENTSGLHLIQGPITVFEGRITPATLASSTWSPMKNDSSPTPWTSARKSTRSRRRDNGRLVRSRSSRACCTRQTKLRETKTYTINNRNDAERLVLVEHPVRNDFHS